MRFGMIITAALAATAFTGASATAAQAQQWCGFTAQKGAIVQCGYSSQQGCENAVGKGAMCFINPYLVMNERAPRLEQTTTQHAYARG
jgi:Protein of unknown function (DUF3551)